MSDNSILNDPFFAPRKTDAAPSTGRQNVLEDPFFATKTPDQRRKEAEVAQQPSVPVGEDVRKAAIAGGTRGLASTLAGGLGSIESFAAEDVPTALRSAGTFVGEKLGMLTPERRAEITSKPLYGDQTEDQKKGFRAPLTGLPTYKGVSEFIKKEGPEFMAYEAKTPEGKIVQTGAEFASQGVPGAIRGAVGRVVVGGLAGLGSEAGDQMVEEGKDDTFGRLAGTLAGLGVGMAGTSIAGKLANTVKAYAAPTGVGEKQLAAALATDIRKGQASMSLDDLKAAQDRGVDVSIFDIAGPETRRLLGRAASMTDETQEAAANYNAFLRQRATQSGARVSEDLSNVFGRPIDAAALTRAIEESNKIELDKIFSLVRSQPQAAAINHNQFGDLMGRPIFQKAMKDAETTAANMPTFDIRPPKITGATPAQATGLFDASGNPIMRPGTSQSVQFGNLSYWHQVNRELRTIITMAQRSGDNVTAASAINAREKLLKALDAVPGYTNARGTSYDAFKAESAPEAGMNFFNNINAMKRDEFVQNFKKLNDEQKGLFSIGFAQQIQDMAKTGNVSGIANRFAKDNIFREKAKLALGPEKFAQIEATVLAENALSKVKELAFVQTQPSYLTPPKIGAITGVALEGAMAGQVWSPDAAIKAAVGAALGMIGKMFINASERRIAERIIPLALSTNPADVASLSKIIASSPQSRQILNRFTTGIANMVTAGEMSGEPAPRASGGRVGYKSGGGVGMDHKAEALKLIARVKANHKANQKATEPLLQHDDTTVAKALAIANKGI